MTDTRMAPSPADLAALPLAERFAAISEQGRLAHSRHNIVYLGHVL
jgi:hypothetical protein